MYHLKLIKGRSYRGVVSASAARPDVLTDDREKYEAALKTGYFKAVEGAPAATDDGKDTTGEKPGETLVGHLDPEQLATMSEEDLAKLAEDMGLDVSGLDTKEALVKAIASEEVQAPATDDGKDIHKMTVDELRAYAKENGISLTGCGTKGEILQKIEESEADAAAAAAIIAGSGQ